MHEDLEQWLEDCQREARHAFFAARCGSKTESLARAVLVLTDVVRELRKVVVTAENRED